MALPHDISVEFCPRCGAENYRRTGEEFRCIRCDGSWRRRCPVCARYFTMPDDHPPVCPHCGWQ